MIIDDSCRILVQNEDIICVICQEDIFPIESVNILSCQHYYHEKCLEEWLKFQNTCPQCRIVFAQKRSDMISTISANNNNVNYCGYKKIIISIITFIMGISFILFMPKESNE